MLRRRFTGSPSSIRPAAAGAAAGEREIRPARSSLVASGTLACRRCDAPIALGAESQPLTTAMTCPYCGHAGVLRDFLSLATPTRPHRVSVRVVTGRRAAAA